MALNRSFNIFTASALVLLACTGSLGSDSSVSSTEEIPGGIESLNGPAGERGALGCPAVCPAWPGCPACPSPASCERPIPPGYKYYPGFGYYKVQYLGTNWFNAQGVCENTGGHLIVINSTDEANLVSKFVEQYGPIEVIFIGFYDVKSDDTFVTVHDELLSSLEYNTWAPGEPDDIETSRCGGFQPNKGYHDRRCTDILPFVCELP